MSPKEPCAEPRGRVDEVMSPKEPFSAFPASNWEPTLSAALPASNWEPTLSAPVARGVEFADGELLLPTASCLLPKSGAPEFDADFPESVNCTFKSELIKLGVPVFELELVNFSVSALETAASVEPELPTF